MRLVIPAGLLIAMAACGVETTEPNPDDGEKPPEDGFQVVTPDIPIGPGREETWCYYTRLPNTAAVGIKRWESQMTDGSHHMIVYFSDNPLKPDGTKEKDCGIVSRRTIPPTWGYAAQTPHQEFTMPDGVGIELLPQQPAMIQMHYLNTSDQEILAHVTLNAHTYAPQETYKKATAYVTFQQSIEIPRGEEKTFGGTCSVPEGAKFFAMSTHSHRFTMRTEVRDGSEPTAPIVYQSTEWEHPGNLRWGSEPFFTFASGKMTYRCQYKQDEYPVVRTGDSAKTDEMCIAIGYYFFADKDAIAQSLCVDSFLIR